MDELPVEHERARSLRRLEPPGDAERFDALEDQVRQQLVRHAAWVQAQSVQSTDTVVELKAALQAEAARLDSFEERVRAVVSRLTESVEAIGGGVRPEQLTVLGEQLKTALTDQLGALVTEQVEVRLAEGLDLRRAEVVASQAKHQDALTQQLAEARSLIAAAIDGSNKRFVQAHEQLSERIEEVARVGGGSAETAESPVVLALVTKVDALASLAGAVRSDGQRLEALETHTRRTDERLALLVEAKIAAMASVDETDRAALRAEVEGAIRIGLAQVRAELVVSVAGIDHLVAGIEGDIDRRVTDVDRRGTAVAVDLVATRVELAALATRGSGELAALTAELAAIRSDLDAAASAEWGALAPLRSDVRALQTQLAELAAAQAEVAARRRPAPTKAMSATKATPAARPVARSRRSSQ